MDDQHDSDESFGMAKKRVGPISKREERREKRQDIDQHDSDERGGMVQKRVAP